MAIRCAAVAVDGTVVSVFMAAESNESIDAPSQREDGIRIVSSAEAEVGDRFVDGVLVKRTRTPEEIAQDEQP